MIKVFADKNVILVERTQMTNLLRESQLQQAGLTEDGIFKVGTDIGADILSGIFIRRWVIN